ncbi:hypothetical protein ACI2LC_07495 [Nonomuraea wenchangensis]|uniref:hypothetical protein n=1 Tax=Nonomuraea wenchangensis TaxID=568860 RepID=UPI0033DEF17E
MRLSRLIAGWFWRVDASLGGDAKPHRGQRFSAAHPVRLGLVTGGAVGGFFLLFSLISAATGYEYAFAPSTLLFCLCVSAFAGLSMMGIGYFERWHQRHYGHYPHETQSERGNQAARDLRERT